MEISNKLKYFLNLTDFQEHLDNNDFEWCYGVIVDGRITCEFTELLLKLKINPLDYLDTVPDCFLYGCDSIAYFTIPNNITQIEGDAFMYSNFNTIDIPDSVVAIEEDAFFGCGDVTLVCHSDRVKELIEESGFEGDIEVK